MIGVTDETGFLACFLIGISFLVKSSNGFSNQRNNPKDDVVVYDRALNILISLYEIYNSIKKKNQLKHIGYQVALSLIFIS